jgi:hypothetical protein
MASAFSHAVAAAAIGTAFPRLPLTSRGLGIVWSIVPDVDVIGFQLGLQARWLLVVLPPSATLIHERHAIDIDLLYGSFRFDPGELPTLEPRLRPGLRSNITIDHDASFPTGLPRHPSVEVLRHSGFEFYSIKDFGFAIDRNRGMAFFWYSPPG